MFSGSAGDGGVFVAGLTGDVSLQVVMRQIWEDGRTGLALGASLVVCFMSYINYIFFMDERQDG